METRVDVPCPEGRIWPAACFCTTPVFKFGAWLFPQCYIAWVPLHGLKVGLEDRDRGLKTGSFLNCPALLIMPQHKATLQDCATAVYKNFCTFLTSLKQRWYGRPGHRTNRITLAFFNVHGYCERYLIHCYEWTGFLLLQSFAPPL